MANEYLSVHFMTNDPEGRWEEDQEVAHEGETVPTEDRAPIHVQLRSDPDKYEVLDEGWRKIPLYLKATDPDLVVFNVVVSVTGTSKAQWRISKTDLGNNRDTWLAAGDSIDFEDFEIGYDPEDWATFWVAAFATENEVPKFDVSVLVSCEGVAKIVGGT